MKPCDLEIEGGCFGNGIRAEENKSWGDDWEPDINVRGSNVDIRGRKKTSLSASCILTPCQKFHSASHWFSYPSRRGGPHFHLIQASRDMGGFIKVTQPCVTGLVPKPTWFSSIILGSRGKNTVTHQVKLGYWKTIKQRRKTQSYCLIDTVVLSRVIHVPFMHNMAQ